MEFKNIIITLNNGQVIRLYAGDIIMTGCKNVRLFHYQDDSIYHFRQVFKYEHYTQEINTRVHKSKLHSIEMHDKEDGVINHIFDTRIEQLEKRVSVLECRDSDCIFYGVCQCKDCTLFI